MKKFIALFALATVASTGITYAQFPTYASDALRFSQTNYGSSARFKGLGNAQISLGGDISSLGGNPAGIGMFTRSEFGFTPEFNNISSNASYLGQDTKSTKNKFNINQAGLVWYNPVVRPKGSDLNKGVISFVWGIGYNRSNDFSGDFSFGGKNQNSSIADFFAEDASTYALGAADLPKGSLASMALGGKLIAEDPTNLTYYKPTTNVGNNQFYNQVKFGSTSEVNFAGAMNISNQFYLGASINFVNVRYGYDSQYTESGTIINTNDPYSLSYSQSQTTNGTGINGRVGLIFKPVNEVRIGATFQTPTWLHMEDVTSEILGNKIGSALYNNNQQNNYVFQYNMRTPYKGSLGASVIIANNALLTADVDYVDYSTIKLSNAQDYYAPSTINGNNADIKDFYTHAFNYRVGGEYKIDPVTLRVGYGYNGSPYKDDNKNLSATKYYNAGIGYKINQYYVDLAYQRAETTNTFSPYTLNDFSEPVADAKVKRNNVFLTFGIRF